MVEALIINGVFLLANLIILALNLKLYTEYFKDRSVSRRTNVTPAADRLAALEAWVTTFEAQLIKNTEALAAIPAWVKDVEARLKALEGKK